MVLVCWEVHMRKCELLLAPLGLEGPTATAWPVRPLKCAVYCRSLNHAFRGCTFIWMASGLSAYSETTLLTVQCFWKNFYVLQERNKIIWTHDLLKRLSKICE